MNIESLSRSSAHAEWQYGYSLPQHYYTSDETYRRDVAMLTKSQWILVDHESSIPEIGDFFLFDIGDENIIIIRGKDRSIRAFYNVCRHRGSRICLTQTGRAKALICPYHAWSYNLDGSVKAAPLMAADFDKETHALASARVEVYEGLIFLNLSGDAAPDFGDYVSRFDEYMKPHGIRNTKVAKREMFPTKANWKLVVENFFECYHCKPSHATYTKVHDAMKLLALGAGSGSAEADFMEKYLPVLEKWEGETRAKGHVTGYWSDDEETLSFQAANRIPIGKGALTETINGKAVAPLLGDFKEYDGGQTVCAFNVASILLINNDYALIFRFIPRGPLDTDVELIWLVRETAVEGVDYVVDDIVHVWSVTTAEDKKITEDNQLGILSKTYRPGRYSTQEKRVADFGSWYIKALDRNDQHVVAG